MLLINRTTLLLGSLTLCVLGGSAAGGAALIIDGTARPDARVAATLPAWLQAQPVRFIDWSADGSLLIATRPGTEGQLYRVRAPDTAPLPLGAGSMGVLRGAAHPYDANVVALVRSGRDDNTRQLVLQHLDTGTETVLTSDLMRDSPVLWAPDGKHIAYASARRNASDVDVYILDTSAAGAQPQLIAGSLDAARSSDWRPLDWSTDGHHLLLLRQLTMSDGLLYSVDTASGQLTALAATAGPVHARDARFAADGHNVVYLGYATDDDLQLRWLDPDSGETRNLSAVMPHDVQQFAVSANGHYLAYTYGDNGLSRLRMIDRQRALDLQPADLPAGIIRSLRFDRSGTRLALAFESPRSPRDIYVFDTGTQLTARWTHSQPGVVDPARFVMPTLLHFPTWDRVDGRDRQLSAYVYRPSSPGVHPVLLWLHDGPRQAWRPGFDGLLQYIVNELGFVVIAPDVRGSDGYGRSFAALDDGSLRNDAVRDIGALLVWVGLQPGLDARHVLVMGQGYGGYLALASLMQYDDRLAGGVDIAGPSNLVTWLSDTAPTTRDAHRAEFGDERDTATRAFLQQVSPLTIAASLHRPLLIVQEADNLDVPASESTQLLARLRTQRADVTYINVTQAGRDLWQSPDRDAIDVAVASFLARFPARLPAARFSPAPKTGSDAVARSQATASAANNIQRSD